MFTRIIALVLLLAFLNSIIAGCMQKLVKVSVNELPEAKKRKITEVILANGDVVKFNDKGARYLRTDIVSGEDTDGKAVGVALKHIGEIRVSQPETVNKEDVEGKKIVEAILHNGYIIKFNEKGGKYDGVTGKVTGYTENGTLIMRSFDNFKELRSSLPDTISRETLLETKSQHIFEITTGSYLIMFDTDGGKLEKNILVIAGMTQGGKGVAIGIDDINTAEISKIDELKTIGTIGGVVVLGILIYVVVKMIEDPLGDDFVLD